MKSKILHSTLLFIFVLGNYCPAAVIQRKFSPRDYRIFEGTIAAELAIATKNNNPEKIIDCVRKDKTLLKFVEAEYGQTILQVAVISNNKISVSTLLKLGASPNVFNSYNGATPLINAAEIGLFNSTGDASCLKLLLKYGADPNLEQRYVEIKNLSVKTPLLFACGHGMLEYVEILLTAGANINYRSRFGENSLYCALTSRSPEIVMYLLKHGADYTKPMFEFKGIKPTQNFITNVLRSWMFPLESDNYKKKLKIIEFLKTKGMDYYKTPVPQYLYNTYSKEYLEKY